MPLLLTALVQMASSLVAWIVAYRAVKLGFFLITAGLIAAAGDALVSSLYGYVTSIYRPMPEWVAAPLSWIIPDNFTQCVFAYLGACAAVAGFRWMSSIQMGASNIAGGS